MTSVSEDFIIGENINTKPPPPPIRASTPPNKKRAREAYRLLKLLSKMAVRDSWSMRIVCALSNPPSLSLPSLFLLAGSEPQGIPARGRGAVSQDP